MSEKLSWISSVISKEFMAPFVVEKDAEYRKDLLKRFSKLRKAVKSAGAEHETMRLLESFTRRTTDSILNYYKGKVASCHRVLKNLVKECCGKGSMGDPIALCPALPFDEKDNRQHFFRARNAESGTMLTAKEMLHLPFEDRYKSGSERFSIAGVPCLYLGNTSYDCWIELGMPPEHNFNVSPILLDSEQRVFDLAVTVGDFINKGTPQKEDVHRWLRKLVLMIASSYVVKEQGRTFKSEYIVPQGVMLACKALDMDGVVCYSKRVRSEVFALSAVNVTLFADFRAHHSHSEICEHLKVGVPFNYAAYGQLSHAYAAPTLSPDSNPINNIKFGDRQYPYRTTKFARFDNFLFEGWKNKDSLEWGNALEE